MNKELVKSYSRHVAATVATAVLALNGDIFSTEGFKAIGAAVLIAILPPVVRWLDINDEQYGNLAAPDHLDEH
jgi:hypothetical protein